jgi:hypothetical protein
MSEIDREEYESIRREIRRRQNMSTKLKRDRLTDDSELVEVQEAERDEPQQRLSARQ